MTVEQLKRNHSRKGLCWRRVLVSTLSLLTVTTTSAYAESSGWSISCGAGYSPTRYGVDKDGSFFPMAHVGREMDGHWLMHIFGGEVKYHLESSSSATFVPVGLGARYNIGGDIAKRPRLYADITPVLAYSRWRDAYGNAEAKLEPGVMESLGMTFPAGPKLQVGVAIGYALTKGRKVTYLDAAPTQYDGLNLGWIAFTVGFAVRPSSRE
jgi:hypothetical protein